LLVKKPRKTRTLEAHLHVDALRSRQARRRWGYQWGRGDQNGFFLAGLKQQRKHILWYPMNIV
jgi:hypothetical protein